MAFCFGDGFDSYAAIGDAGAGYWDTQSTSSTNIAPGRFAGSQCWQYVNTGGAGFLTKSSGVNDAVHHIVCAFRQTAALAGSTNGAYFQLIDNVTNQVCIVFRSDGAILLTSATPAGTVLDTYTGAVTANNTWFAFEFEIVIHNTAGSWAVRKNGNTVNDRATGSLNTRPGANAYANKLLFGVGTVGVTAQQFDDLLWRSDASSVPFVGDVRCYTRMPANDVTTTFAKSPVTSSQSTPSGSSVPVTTGTARYTSITPAYSGTIGTITATFNSASTCNMKCTIFASSGTAPTTVLGSANIAALSAVTTINFTFGTPVAVVKGTQYWVGFEADASSGTHTSTAAATGLSSATAYASFPVASPGTVSAVAPSLTFIVTTSINADMVSETLQDGTTSYVYSSNPTDADFYTVSPLAGTPAAVIAVVTRGFLQKSDAGTRGAAVQLKSGGAFASTTWNPSDLVATTLSGGNLTTTATGAGGVRSIFVASAGKWYWEVLFSGAGVGVGVANASAALATVWNTPTNAAVAYNGSIYINNVSTGSSISIPTGTTVCVAVDIGAQLIWFRAGAAGQWNGSGTANPATGTGGLNITALGSSLMALVATSGGGSYVANFGATAFVGAVPSGFTAGFGSTGTIVQSTPTLLGTNFGWLYRTDTVDPATGAAWTPIGVNNVQIGPVVTS